MAKDILYIDEGINVDVTWTGHIVISSDGVVWDGISIIQGVSVGTHSINLNTSVTNSYPERNKEEGYVVTITGKDGLILKFNPSKVLNQAGWIAGTPQQNAIAAVADILNWLS